MISLFELLKIGIGPSSSHTVGPMLAALTFAQELEPQAEAVQRIQVELFGSLGLTGIGHRTDYAVLMGLCGEHPRTVAPNSIDARVGRILESQQLNWLDRFQIPFDAPHDLLFNRQESLPQHPNGMRCQAWSASGALILQREYFSIGGGFVVTAEQLQANQAVKGRGEDTGSAESRCPFPFTSADELLEICRTRKLSIAEVIHRNELAFYSSDEIDSQLDAIWQVMTDSIAAGCRTEGVLAGGLGIRRRAPEIFRKLSTLPNGQSTTEPPPSESPSPVDPLQQMDWVTLYALAVNEENAAGGRVVTAPTNGASGVIPAVARYYERFMPKANRAGVHEFLKTAAAIGMLYKRNASLSAAEMGCQGEVGVACSMAAGGLAAVMGGSPQQIENAAEIGMEHNLGLTCDPIAGLVQVPCIERNAMGAIKAINAARLAVLYGDGQHRVSLDRVIETMRQTGVDMQSKYKETSLGGLAVNVPIC